MSAILPVTVQTQSTVTAAIRTTFVSSFNDCDAQLVAAPGGDCSIGGLRPSGIVTGDELDPHDLGPKCTGERHRSVHRLCTAAGPSASIRQEGELAVQCRPQSRKS